MVLGNLLAKPKGEGTQEDMAEEERWNGVPPVGDQPIDNRWKFLQLVLLVFVVKILIWSVYRWLTGNFEPLTDRVTMYWVTLFAKPLLQLGPVFPLWWYIFKERGNPFRITRTNLASSVFWGCFGGLIFYIVASVIFVAHLVATGQGADFHVVAGWNVEGVGWGLVIATMFSYMISTGPAEELFSRGFLQDQTARAFPILHAIIFSAVLFAIGHLPISIMVHHLGLEAIMWYMLTLFIMGIFFSLIYHWSRNIVLGIIIHGLWDWYLTLFQVKGAYSRSVIENPAAAFGLVDFVNTIITLAVMIPFFYFLYLTFWKKDAREMGEEEEGKGFVWWMRRMDCGHWEKPWRKAIAFTTVFCLVMIPVASGIDVQDPTKRSDRPMEPIYETMKEKENMTRTGMVLEGQAVEHTIAPDQGVINSVDATLKWQDEENDTSPGPVGIVEYDNEPDTFRLLILSEDGDVLKSDESSGGSIRISWSGGEGNGSQSMITIRIELVEAGDQVPPIPVLPTNQDDSNEYQLTAAYEREWKREVGDSEDIRW